jgi:hypothetical protein
VVHLVAVALEAQDGLLTRIVVFLDATLFPAFGLPATLPA